MRIAVIGGGSWGTALAHLLSGASHQVAMLVRDEKLVREINAHHANPRYLPGFSLHPGLTASTDAAAVLPGSDICLLAVPAQATRRVLRELAPLAPEKAVPVCVSKGIETGTLLCMKDVIAAEWPLQAARYAALSGPSFACEVAAGKPAAVVLACADAHLGANLRVIFSTGSFRVYSSTDVAGVELGGAVKNVMAIAAGLCDGQGFGDNARAALITRGLAEMSRLGVALGGRASTFMGLSGMGDLVLTCTGALSRNRRVGLMLGQGVSLEEAVASLGQVAEGVKTTEAVCELAVKHGIELPVAETVLAVMRGKVKVSTAVDRLMARELKEE